MEVFINSPVHLWPIIHSCLSVCLGARDVGIKSSSSACCSKAPSAVLIVCKCHCYQYTSMRHTCQKNNRTSTAQHWKNHLGQRKWAEIGIYMYIHTLAVKSLHWGVAIAVFHFEKPLLVKLLFYFTASHQWNFILQSLIMLRNGFLKINIVNSFILLFSLFFWLLFIWVLFMICIGL